ncbi:heptosyltransferase-2 [Andreprevotia lacus DSM 23236]|jgi:heptosyltransferase-2|uniref:lipopolysaccharide heptosyltransferase II n=1 Tax=Andreprevotia lacus DSM 23236 TaxID=1121001 RepID=A0A1W1WXI6_9NEIS|nr:lipopolysaccharide heptosyltransferase II [Andreprevotia lacus]SMC16456.1 heptosyltransferase-2 [Andreprevotia lacus DSM 23236]
MKKILIVAPAWVGDAIMAQPLYARLKALHPDAQIDVLAPAWTRPLHARMAEISESFDNPFGHGQLKLGARWKLARQLKQRGYDQAILLPNSLKSALIPFFAGIPVRTGWTGEARYGLVNDLRVLKPAELPQMVERFAALAEVAGEAPARPIPHPRLRVNSAERQATLHKLGLNLARPIVACCPGAEYGPAKRWPAQHFAEFARDAMSRGLQVWLFGSGKDKEIADEIAALAPGVQNLASQTTLAEAIDLMSFASVAVCNDSGLMHVAAALQVPLAAIYGSSSPEFTPPLSAQAEIVTLDLECSPCFERSCPLGHMNCLNQLDAPRVAAAVARLRPDIWPSTINAPL